jgi:CMP-N-acetylneuraminic acid synthetase
MLRTVAIIPARGGSKRVPGKNTIVVNGRSMLERCIDNIKAAQIFDEIIVSSDDEFTLNEANRLGVTGLQRISELSSDAARVDEVCLQVVSNSIGIGAICCVYPTAILLRPQTIINSSDMFGDRRLQSLIGVSRYNFNPVEAFSISRDNTLVPLLPDWRGKKSQEFPSTCVSNGTLYWSSVRHLTQYESLISHETQPFFVPENEVCDVNTFEDLDKLNDLVLKLESRNINNS